MLLLLVAGVGAGLAGSIAGLASLFSYPALLAVGLPPIAANVTNTVAMFSTTVGAATGSRAELRGQKLRIGRLIALAVAGGTLGAILLLNTSTATFERVVPWLIALGSLLLLMRTPLRRIANEWGRQRGEAPRATLPLACAVVLVGVYSGYFGAAAGVLMLAVLSLSLTEPLPVTNAVKNLLTGAANLAAAIGYAFLAPVNWGSAGILAVGCLIGAWTGPAIVRRLPERPLRIAVALGGLALAVHLWLATTH